MLPRGADVGSARSYATHAVLQPRSTRTRSAGRARTAAGIVPDMDMLDLTPLTAEPSARLDDAFVENERLVVGVVDERPAARVHSRELSWIAFNERVVELAAREDLPLLERAKFLAIGASNLDEFFQVRVAGLKELIRNDFSAPTPDGRTPTETLAGIRHRVQRATERVDELAHSAILPALSDAGIRLSGWLSLDFEDRDWLTREFEERVFPVLTPLAVDPAHPFPYISNLSMNLAVELREPGSSDHRFARVKVPPILPRFVVLPDGERFVPLEQVIAAHLDRLFPGMRVVSHYPFRVTRNADLVVEEEDADDLLVAVESQLTNRGRGRVVRLEIEPHMAESTLQLLMRELRISRDDVVVTRGPLDLSGLMALMSLDRPELKHPTASHTTSPRLASGDIFAAMRESNVLLHHPYESFATSVQAFIEQAARDPDVLAIKQTLYRTSGPDSPIVKALIHAADEGKQVVALVEIKARFDEEANIEWARALEQRGVHVVYGVVGFKTHTKIALVVREEGGRTRRYCHIGTGNYNDKTARIYEDVGLLTCNPEIGADLSDLFNFLTGYSRQRAFRRLLVAPVTLRDRLVELIRNEAAHGRDGRIVMKMNSLVDAPMVEELYAASEAGASIDLIVRGTCCLRPGLPGMSENIRVRSIIGRYLEHSRIYRFGNDDRGKAYLMGSADLMPRNLDRRVEAVVPILAPELQDRLEQILQVNLADDVLAWQLKHDGTWTRVPRGPGDPVETHETLEALALAAVRAAER